ncbi:hypothetical protein ACHAXM_003757 [Skeletonema potamos]
MAASSSAAEALPPASYHLGDPLDIPLIDHHLLVHMLCPRITSAIRYAFPRLYLDWTTGVAADEDTSRNAPSFIRKRWVDMLLHTSLILGSCHFRRKRNNSKEMSVYLATPAMKNLGMILRPAANNNDQNSPHNKIKVYSKIIALVLATVVVPALYEELKLRRQRELQMQETRLRLAQLRQEFQITSNATTGPQRQETLHQGDVMLQRAQKRRALIQRLLIDSILGMSDILIPPLRLITYVSYLWGLCPTPNFGSSMIGWEYASVTDVQGSSSDVESMSILTPYYQRHANFQYGNRRLLVEEGLRTMASILPPRTNLSVQPDVDNGRRRQVEETSGSENSRSSTNITATAHTLTTQRRMGWMRQRALSFMGVIEEEEEIEQRPVDNSYVLNCSLCRTVPAVPYITSCGHCYCYMCLRMAVTEDPYYRCVCCRKRIDSSSRPTTKSPSS